MDPLQLVSINFNLDTVSVPRYNDPKEVKYMNRIMQQVAFTSEEQTFFLDLYHSLSTNTLVQLETLKQRYLQPVGVPADVNMEIKAELTTLAESLDINPYSLHMLFVLLCAPELPRIYRENGLDEKFAYQLSADIRSKLTECEKCKQVMGAQTMEWFHPYFMLKRFPLGRFQYDLYNWDLDDDYHFGDIHIRKGDPVYKIHIPSSGKMTRQMRLESYCLAHDFFGYKKGEPIPLFCRTWLLYDGYRACYSEGSNLWDFRDDFDMVENFEVEGFGNAWRIFNRDFDGDTSVLPGQTTLQRNFIEYIEKGGKHGSASGVIICDGERILNNKRDN